jgi:transposase-like protein
MNININVDDIDKLNLRKIHDLTSTQDLVGSIIHSDEWRAYTGLRNNRNFYAHETVNHSLHFVQPTTHVHTQNIENTWMRLKRKQKKQNGIARALLNTYLEEFIWHQEYGDKPFKNLILQISSIYPLQ